MDEGFVDKWSVGFMEKLPIISWGKLQKLYYIPNLLKKLQVIYMVGKNIN
jgi:hypothetical protein